MKNLKNIDLKKISGGKADCMCLHVYDSTLITTPLETVKNYKDCRNTCCSFNESRFKFDGMIYNCYKEQSVLNLCRLRPPRNNETRLFIERAKRDGEVFDALNVLVGLARLCD